MPCIVRHLYVHRETLEAPNLYFIKKSMLLLLVIWGYVDQIFDNVRCFMCTCAMNTIRSISKVLISRMSPAVEPFTRRHLPMVCFNTIMPGLLLDYVSANEHYRQFGMAPLSLDLSSIEHL